MTDIIDVMNTINGNYDDAENIMKKAQIDYIKYKKIIINPPTPLPAYIYNNLDHLNEESIKKLEKYNRKLRIWEELSEPSNASSYNYANDMKQWESKLRKRGYITENEKPFTDHLNLSIGDFIILKYEGYIDYNTYYYAGFYLGEIDNYKYKDQLEEMLKKKHEELQTLKEDDFYYKDITTITNPTIKSQAEKINTRIINIEEKIKSWKLDTMNINRKLNTHLQRRLQKQLI